MSPMHKKIVRSLTINLEKTSYFSCQTIGTSSIFYEMIKTQKPIKCPSIFIFSKTFLDLTWLIDPTTFPTRTSGRGAGYPSGKLQLPMYE